MKKLFWLNKYLLILAVLALACLNPPHDNKFDPDNPDKAKLTGRITSPEGGIKYAWIELILVEPDTEELYDTTESDVDGVYEITRIDPGIYRLCVYADYYSPRELCERETLAAGETDTVDIFLNDLLFTFDNEVVGTSEPFGFSVRKGIWEVKEDTDPYSWPNVYNSVGNECLSLVNRPVSAYNFGAAIKLDDPSDPGFVQAGMILNWQDSVNYYVVTLTMSHQAHLIKVENNSWIPLDVDTITLSYNTWFNVSADVYDGHFEIYVDCTKILEADDATFPGGSCGLQASKEGGLPISVNFDDVRLSRW